MAPVVSAGLEYRLYHTQHRECSCGAKDCQGACKAKGGVSLEANLPPPTFPSNGSGALVGHGNVASMSYGNGPHGSNGGHGAGRKRKLSDMAGNKMSASQSLMVDAALMSLATTSDRVQFSSQGRSQGPSQGRSHGPSLATL